VIARRVLAADSVFPLRGMSTPSTLHSSTTMRSPLSNVESHVARDGFWNTRRFRIDLIPTYPHRALAPNRDSRSARTLLLSPHALSTRRRSA
jgi:hypothetical protein